MEQGRHKDAEPLLVEALEIYDRAGCGPYPVYARALGVYCDLLRATGRDELAETVLAERAAGRRVAEEPASAEERR